MVCLVFHSAMTATVIETILRTLRVPSSFNQIIIKHAVIAIHTRLNEEICPKKLFANRV